MKVGDLVAVKAHAIGTVCGINFETGEYIRIKPTAPPMIVTKLVPKTVHHRGGSAEVYLPWRSERCRVAKCDVVVISGGLNQ